MWRRIEDIGRIGALPEGGISRFAFSNEDKTAANLIKTWMEEAGLSVWTDTVGNLYGRREGELDYGTVLTGSHIDSVPNGGRFDGVAGVIAALECMQVLHENNVKTKHPLEMVVFVNEEGSRFPGGLMGSQAVAGLLSPEFVSKIKDNEGVSLVDAMKEYGADPDRIKDAHRPGDFQAFFELHIEQASLLEDRDIPVGIVSGIAGPYQMKVKISGRSGHAGATPMELRKDPMVGASLIIQEVERLAIEFGTTTRGTVGYIKARPGGHNVIPSEVEFTIDIRDIDPTKREKVVKQIKDYIKDTCLKRGLEHEVFKTQDMPPVPVIPEVVDLLEKTAKECNIPTITMPSGAAHDAMVMASLCPIGMIFVRSRDGLSHCPEEFTSKEDLKLGTTLLLHSLVKTANGKPRL